MRKHTCMHALCANIHKAHTRIQYVCVNECWPGVPLGGNYSARRGSILTASCFLSLSVATGSIPEEHDCLITILSMCVFV